MPMTKLQWGVIAAALALFLILYLGCDRKPKEISSLDQSRALATESTDVQALISEARGALAPAQSAEVLALEEELAASLDDSTKLRLNKALSSAWYSSEEPAVAGYYAQAVAELAGTAESWSIAGTTYTICIQRSEEERKREFCTGRAVQAFESAISLAPDDMANRVNLALVYTTNPPADNPMKGILMLRELNQEAPDNVLVLNALGRLAIRTGQFDRAVERLSQALNAEPQNPATVCLLAQAYEGQGDEAQAAVFAERCRSLTD